MPRYQLSLGLYEYRSIFDDSVSYMAQFWTKFENLECEIHENRIFSIFLQVVCTRKKMCSIVYFLRFVKICLSANNPEEFELLNVRIVHCSAKSMQLKHLANFTAHHFQQNAVLKRFTTSHQNLRKEITTFINCSALCFCLGNTITSYNH